MTRRIIAAVALAAAAALPAAGSAQDPTQVPDELVVGLSMPTPGFQVGVVRDREVLQAKGLEIDLARAVAGGLGIPAVRFVNEASFPALLDPLGKDWDLGIGQLTVTANRAETVDFSTPYFIADQGVLLGRRVKLRSTTRAALGRLRLCALKGSTGAQVIRARVPTTRPVRLVRNASRLEADLYQRRCDAVVNDAPQLGVLRSQAPDRVGALAGRLVTGERWAMSFPKGSPVRAMVNDALRQLEQDGTLTRLERKWLTTDTGNLPVIR